ncbi:hypothetical protein RJ641_025672 [Dillenia turbinata]|uniref:Uncharacterized protein n=1 Tax=Dillenia turbinata TaxID=194707 RepID=A0AAN8W229_9MAGN
MTVACVRLHAVLMIVELMKSSILYTEKRNDPSGSGLIFDNESDRINPFYSIYSKARIQKSLKQNQGTIRILLNRNKECQSLIILSSSNCSRMGLFNNVKYYNGIKESIKSIKIKKDPLIPIRNFFGPLGAALQIANFYSFYHLITHNQILKRTSFCSASNTILDAKMPKHFKDVLYNVALACYITFPCANMYPE